MSRRFEIWLVNLDPTVGSEMQKTRPAVIVSPDEMNERLHTVLIAPLTSRGFTAPFRAPCRFENLDDTTARAVLAILAEVFSP